MLSVRSNSSGSRTRKARQELAEPARPDNCNDGSSFVGSRDWFFKSDFPTRKGPDSQHLDEGQSHPERRAFAFIAFKGDVDTVQFQAAFHDGQFQSCARHPARIADVVKCFKQRCLIHNRNTHPVVADDKLGLSVPGADAKLHLARSGRALTRCKRTRKPSTPSPCLRPVRRNSIDCDQSESQLSHTFRERARTGKASAFLRTVSSCGRVRLSHWENAPLI